MTECTVMKSEKYDHSNPIHRAIFFCVIEKGIGDCSIVVTYPDNKSGYVITNAQYGRKFYKWNMIKGNKIRCCRKTERIEYEKTN